VSVLFAGCRCCVYNQAVAAATENMMSWDSWQLALISGAPPYSNQLVR